MAGLQWNCCPWSCVAGGGALGLVEGVAWACGGGGLGAWRKVWFPCSLTCAKQCELILQIKVGICQRHG